MNIYNPYRSYHIVDPENSSSSNWYPKKKNNKWIKVILFTLIQIISIPIVIIGVLFLATLYINPLLPILCGILGALLIINWWLFTHDLIFRNG